MEWTAEATRGKSAVDLIRIQLEEWMFDDPALMESYDPAKAEDCLAWVAEELRSNTEHTAVMAIWHDDVFRLARDYFVDGHAKGEANEAKTPGKAKVGSVSAKKTEETQTALFGVAAKGGS